LNAGLLPTTRKVSTPINVDYSKHYNYHHNHGRNIEECIAIRDKIKELVHADHLYYYWAKVEESLSNLRRQ